MRTTVTIDSDVASLLEREMRQKGLSFKEALNQAVRRGLASSPTESKPLLKFAMKARADLNLDKALQLSAELEDEEALRKYRLGK